MNGRGPSADAAGRGDYADVKDGHDGSRHGAPRANGYSAPARAGKVSAEPGRGAGRVQTTRGGRHSQAHESAVNTQGAAAAAKAAAEAASVSVDIAPQVFTQALAKLETFNIQVCGMCALLVVFYLDVSVHKKLVCELMQECVQETPKIPVPSTLQRPVRESKGRRGQARGRLDMNDKIKDANADAMS